MNHPLLAGLP